MQHFEFRVQGLRPSSIVLSVVTRDADSARAMAERVRKGYKDHTHIDVWRAKRYLFTVGPPASIEAEHSIPGGLAAASSI
jgi:hypothetical protein